MKVAFTDDGTHDNHGSFDFLKDGHVVDVSLPQPVERSLTLVSEGLAPYCEGTEHPPMAMLGRQGFDKGIVFKRPETWASPGRVSRCT